MMHRLLPLYRGKVGMGVNLDVRRKQSQSNNDLKGKIVTQQHD